MGLPAVFLLPTGAWAGGDMAEGYVSQFLGADGHYRFTFTEKPSEKLERYLLRSGCPSFQVQIIPPRKTTWQKIGEMLSIKFLYQLPGGHPTPQQTEASAAVLKEAIAQKRLITLGYIGSGLYPDREQSCLFYGTGMEVTDKMVFVYQDNRAELYSFMRENP